jgi:hypothetical protein
MNRQDIIQFEEFRSNTESIRIMKSHIKNVIQKYGKSLEKDLIPIRQKQNVQISNAMNLFKNSDEFVKYFELISEYESLSRHRLKDFSKIVSEHKKHAIEYINLEDDRFFNEISIVEREIEALYELEVVEEEDKKMDDWIIKKVQHKLSHDVSKIDSLISHAKSLDSLCQMYEGWMPWV